MYFGSFVTLLCCEPIPALCLIAIVTHSTSVFNVFLNQKATRCLSRGALLDDGMAMRFVFREYAAGTELATE